MKDKLITTGFIVLVLIGLIILVQFIRSSYQNAIETALISQGYTPISTGYTFKAYLCAENQTAFYFEAYAPNKNLVSGTACVNWWGARLLFD